jgi:four helix bundle protein
MPRSLLCFSSMAKTLSPERERTLRLQGRVFRFGCAVVNCCPQRTHDIASRELWRQLVKAATSVSANLEEADEASSDADFVAKMKTALREAKESRLLIRFLTECKLAEYRRVQESEDEARQLAAIFATIIINVKRRMEAEKMTQSSTR